MRKSQVTALLAAVAALALTTIPGSAPPSAAALQVSVTATASAPDLAALVNPFIGTAGGGNTFPGADTPFGMLQWSPDTTHRKDGGGYSARSRKITGFSLTHMSGPGCRTAGDVPILPTVGAVRPAADDAFRRSAESARAGYYSVRLADRISVGLTATTRTGLAEFTFPAGRRGNLIFKLDGSQNGDTSVHFHRDSATAVQGTVTSPDFSCGMAAKYTLHFRMDFSRPTSGFGTLAGGDRYVSFGSGPPVLAKVGISYVSTRNAAANLAAEDPGWDFAAIRSAAQRSWNRLLGKIAITGGSRAQRVVFYTALYHALLAPSVFSDVNGQYTGAGGDVYTVGAGQSAEYTNFSGWDIYRTQAQLEALLDPAAASGAAQSLLNAYQQTGMLPRWQAYGHETYVMVGDPADSIIADYAAFGASGFDTSAALSAMIAQASRPDDVRPGLSYLKRLGYLPENGSYGCCRFQAAVATSLEYNTADFALSALAGRLGRTAVERRFRARAHDWANLLNEASGMMQPRLAGGGWSADFSPTSLTGFIEGDSWQYTGMVPFDVAGVATAMGGNAAMRRYLGRVLKGFRGRNDAAIAGMGNEPSIELPWEYDYIGMPYATQRTVREIQDKLWRDAPGGIPGNDDLGAMSAWFVWSALGMYPMTPGTAILALGSPLFSRAVITLPDGKTLTIEASGARTGQPYVHSATWDGAAWTRAYVPSPAITTGGTIAFRLGSKPDRGWAASAGDAPPSYGS
jgi:predicted alpha-1,2-mannosidase